MTVEEFAYDLPEELIAQTPLEKRDASRMMVLDRKTKEFHHDSFSNILSYLKKGDALVLNDTKVLPARLIGEKEETEAGIEVLLLRNTKKDTWETLVKPARRVKVGTVVSFGNGKLKATCLEEREDGIRIFFFSYEGIFYEILEELGTMPLPPYIHETLVDQGRYQTVYAKETGSAAAPTAGLHFTKEILEEAQKRGVSVCYITLHVGLGTFRPVKVDKVEEHHMHSEYYHMSAEVASTLQKTKQNGGRIISVGTTSTRTLETIMTKYERFKECSGWTDIFIYPGYTWKAVDGLLTNFHLPKSTLIMLVSSFAGKDFIMEAYREAVKERYRFFSFGDCMLIL